MSHWRVGQPSPIQRPGALLLEPKIVARDRHTRCPLITRGVWFHRLEEG
jgi:hypothetical protein